MLFIDNPSLDPQLNLALEEHLFFQKTEEIFMLWQNRSSIIVGKNQNAMAEIDYSYVTEHAIEVVRRLSGGGAVYHDTGNLNFTYIVNREGFGDYVGFTETLRAFLKTLGITATVSGRNDVLVNGRKISGNAQFAHGGRLLHHGTILIGADMSHLAAALRPDAEKIKSKGIASVRSRVANLSEILPLTAEEFRQKFARFFLEHEEGEAYSLTDADFKAAEKLKAEKYSTYAWNFGYSPKYTFHKKAYFPGGGVEVFLDIQNGIIRDARIFGDFFGDGEALAKRLLGIAHSAEEIRNVLEKEPLAAIDLDALLTCFI